MSTPPDPNDSTPPATTAYGENSGTVLSRSEQALEAPRLESDFPKNTQPVFPN